MSIFILIVVFSVLIASISQIFLKKSSMISHTSFLKEYLNYRVFIGYTLLVISVFLNLIALKYGVRVKDMPIVESLSYFFVPLLSYLFLQEKLTKKKMLATGIIFTGIFVFYL
ncbi:MAG: EamA family transporter [Bacteroidetes bacterium]|nr:EamA family transporter [Bacteroidota bacterium]